MLADGALCSDLSPRFSGGVWRAGGVHGWRLFCVRVDTVVYLDHLDRTDLLDIAVSFLRPPPAGALGFFSIGLCLNEVDVSSQIWSTCLENLALEIPQNEMNTWIRPLQAVEEEDRLRLLAPNQFVIDWIRDHFMAQINKTVQAQVQRTGFKISLEVGSLNPGVTRPTPNSSGTARVSSGRPLLPIETGLDPLYTFENFVIGKSNQMGHAAALQVAGKPGHAYNPLFIYGGTGLGKTHLMHAAGNLMMKNNPKFRLLCLRSETFLNDMVQALQRHSIDEFKKKFRTIDALLMDDIHFFVNKTHTQEELFHTFNSLLEGKQQIIFTSDRFPKDIEGLEDRLKSRFGWGLTVAIDPPELETRVAILISKAELKGVVLPPDVGFLIAQRIRSNVRDLEGALHRVIANASFTGEAITVDFAKQALRDQFLVQERMVTLENIQKATAEYFKIRLADLSSQKRTRSITRPRQIAMALSRELTRRSLPEIGAAFGGRDHTTVLHACAKVKEFRAKDSLFDEDYRNLLRTLSI